MPPFGNPKNQEFNKLNIVTIDVGGQLFQTTIQTLTLAGTNTFFSKLFNSSSEVNNIPFIDRDSELFSIILSILRTGNLPSKAKIFEIQNIVFEAKFYGVESLLVQSQSNPSQFEPFDLEKLMILPVSGVKTHLLQLLVCYNTERVSSSLAIEGHMHSVGYDLVPYMDYGFPLNFPVHKGVERIKYLRDPWYSSVGLLEILVAGLKGGVIGFPSIGLVEILGGFFGGCVLRVW
ncbi:BTB/POZ domain-containing protein At5g41330-like [Rutidosis leptorrhynchoides]|uniref:BTB/POZ domain-containing protein At5g41330-like n=1 Tax=Rutidosis leptorrhynchoides TaxID=125765 RepID=UPI003A99AE71